MPILQLKSPRFTVERELTSLGDGTIRPIGQVPIDFPTVEVTGIFNAAVETEVFDGVGLDDMSSGGSYSGPGVRDYVVEIDGTGTPDTFKWSDDDGATWEATTENIVPGAQTLNFGVTITFLATTGHTATDKWTFSVGANFVTTYSASVQADETTLTLAAALTTALGGASTAIWVTYNTDSIHTMGGIPTKSRSGIIPIVCTLPGKAVNNPDVDYEIADLVGGGAIVGIKPNLTSSKGFLVQLIIVVTDGTDIDIALYVGATATRANMRYKKETINLLFNSSEASPGLNIPIESETIYIAIKDDGVNATPANTYVYIWGSPIL